MRMPKTKKQPSKNNMVINIKLAFDAKSEMLRVLYALKKEIETLIKFYKNQG